MPKLKLTQKSIQELPLPIDKAKVQYFDTEFKGFMIEIKNTGTKTYYYRYRANKKQKMIKLGTSTETSFQEAKKRYHYLKENQSNFQQASDSEEFKITFQEFYDNHYLPYITTHIKSYGTNLSIFKNHILKELSDMPMHSLKKIEVRQHHSNMVHKKKLSPATANKFLIFLTQAYNLAHEFEVLPPYINPCKGVKCYKLNNERQIFLTKQETKRLINQVNNSQNIHLKYIIQMLLLTGARRGEVLKATWNQFDMNHMLWTIPLTKNGRKRVLPITKSLKKLLKEIPKESPYLFTSPKTGKPYISIYNSWNTARVKANLPQVRIHDLRHTYASVLVNSKCSLYEVQILLGHSTSKMTQRYAHLSNEALMKAASYAGKLLQD